ncbi:hypothetical protein [Halobacteriovorax sp. HLS]|uniref:hypothetical protein n=1 Tax=Halobacteriovorax sp. HLS TaxID=2234000 RepID=UPI000FD6E17F|nr:hypothetical protein [Halobacteriovorax sp. HLS]
MKTILVSLIFLALTGCSHSVDFKSSRRPASTKIELQDLLDSFSSKLSAKNSLNFLCSDNLTNYYQNLLNVRGDDIDMESMDEDAMRDIVKSSFATRLELKKKISSFNKELLKDEGCLNSIKDMVRALRYVEDYMIEREYTKLSYIDKMEFVTLSGEGTLFLKNPKYRFNGIQDLKSGDVILSRGNAYTSAAIARIGNTDTQFSHLSLVYEHTDGQLYTIEAHIEIGSVVKKIQVNVDQQNARSVVFRHHDSKLAHEAAKIMFHKVKKEQDKKKNIQYDFAMDYKNGKRIFCSEVVSHGFDLASKKLYGKSLDLPLHKTKFNKGLIPFLQTLGIQINESNVDSFDTFGPGDIQFEPSFDMVAEWRNPKKMKDNRFKDAILTKMFQWMENEKYELHPPAGIEVKSRFSWLMRRTPFVKKMLEEKFPLNMNSSQLRLFLVLDLVGEKFYDVISDQQVARGRVLSPIEIYDVLDQFKTNDYQRYMKYKQLVKKSRTYRSRREVPLKVKREIKETRPVFHRYFHN